MNVRSIKLRRFLSHESTDVELPERGIVVVTGANGQGKSTLAEAVSYALYGKTLRGSSPWREDGDGEVEVCTDLVDACRLRKGGKTTLNWWEAGLDASTGTVYESTTKSQEALEAIVGPWDVWRRTSVFSSQDAAHFTQATDGERKRLLETILQLDRFDVALDRCRGELRAAERDAAGAQRDSEITAAKLEAAERALAKAEDDLKAQGKAPDAEALQCEADECGDAVKSCDADIAGLRDAVRRADQLIAEKSAQENEQKRALQRLEDGTCPTCGQPTEVLAKKMRGEVARLAKAVKDAQSKGKDERHWMIEQLHELEDARQEHADRRSELLAQVAAAGKALELRKRAEKARASALEEHRALSEAMLSARADTERAARDLAELQACERVLGLRGVRAAVLGRALKGVEAAANAWLSRLAAGEYRLSLRATTEKKSGGTSDAISLEVVGRDGRDYRSCSGGERRRIDVALLFALAEVAAAAAGSEPGDIFADECFDALDQDGVAAVAAALGDIAARRKVFVITHRDDLAAAIPAALRLRVEGGCVV